MKIYYSRTKIKDGETVEIKAEYNIDFEVESRDQAFIRLKTFVDEKLNQEFQL